tara:strand:+ start:11299 stop:11463 length:165 start_codon:yes stop_codon:yes gene_type:complete
LIREEASAGEETCAAPLQAGGGGAQTAAREKGPWASGRPKERSPETATAAGTGN